MALYGLGNEDMIILCHVHISKSPVIVMVNMSNRKFNHICNVIRKHFFMDVSSGLGWDRIWIVCGYFFI